MKTLFAFFKKEYMEIIRSGKFTILLIVFFLFGIMNPAMAKITPWLMETMASSLKDTGLIVSEIKVNALTSWTQYYKNIPMALIIFVLLVSNTFTREYQTGTLVLVLTKGLSRYKVITAKTAMMLFLWTFCYWGCFLITYGYNSYFWDNSIASNLFYAVFCYWLFGIWVLTLVVLFSSFVQSNTAVLGGVGGTVIVLNLINLYPDVKQYLPIKLMGGLSLLTNEAMVKEFNVAVLITITLSILFVGCSMIIFNHKMFSSQ